MADNWQLKAVLSAVDQMSPVLKGVANAAKSTRKYLSDVASAANGLTSKIGLPLTAISGVLGGFSLVAVKNAVVGFTEMGEALYKSSLRTGMSVEQLQRMKYVADQAGVPVEALEGGLGKLNRNIGMAAAGKSKDLAELFKRLGISARDANGELRSGVDILPQLSDAFVRNKNPVVQARMGMALFGKSWQEMVPLLAEGSDGIQRSLERFKQLKGVMSLDDIKGAKELGDQFKDLEFVTKGFQNTIAKELVPVLGPLIEDIIQWAAANRKVVAAGVKEFVRDLVAGMREIDWKGVVQGAQDFCRGLGQFIEMVGGAKNALIGLIFVMNIQTIMAIGSLFGAIGRAVLALGSILMANPIIGVTLAIAAAAYLVYKNWDMIRGWFSSFFDWIGSKLRTALEWMGPLGWIALAIVDNWGALKEWFSGFFGWISDNWRSVLEKAGVFGSIALVLIDNWLLVKDWFSAFFGWIGDKFQLLLGWVGDVANTANSIFGDGAKSFSEALRPGSGVDGASAAASMFGRPSLVGAGNGRVDGQVKIDISGLPPGSRVEQVASGGNMPINLDAGYRSAALEMPY